MIRVQCAHRWPEGTLCASPLTDHVHQPPPCANGAPERHHDFIADLDHLRAYLPELTATLAAIAPVLTRRERIAMRKALLAGDTAQERR